MIYNIPSNSSVKFHIYAPTFSQGITSNGPIYAGSTDWDPTGQYLIYDEYNQLSTNDSTQVNYWDIGLMQVWDNTANTWKDSGLVSKLINSLPDGVSIGNPVYSKNHANIVAFDYLDTTGAFNAWGADINTGTTGVILAGRSAAEAISELTFTCEPAPNRMPL